MTATFERKGFHPKKRLMQSQTWGDDNSPALPDSAEPCCNVVSDGAESDDASTEIRPALSDNVCTSKQLAGLSATKQQHFEDSDSATPTTNHNNSLEAQRFSQVLADCGISFVPRANAQGGFVVCLKENPPMCGHHFPSNDTTTVVHDSGTGCTCVNKTQSTIQNRLQLSFHQRTLHPELLSSLDDMVSNGRADYQAYCPATGQHSHDSDLAEPGIRCEDSFLYGAFLNSLLLPMHVIFQATDHHDAGFVKETYLDVEASLVDMLLPIPSLQQTLLSSLIRKFCELRSSSRSQPGDSDHMTLTTKRSIRGLLLSHIQRLGHERMQDVQAFIDDVRRSLSRCARQRQLREELTYALPEIFTKEAMLKNLDSGLSASKKKRRCGKTGNGGEDDAAAVMDGIMDQVGRKFELQRMSLPPMDTKNMEGVLAVRATRQNALLEHAEAERDDTTKGKTNTRRRKRHRAGDADAMLDASVISREEFIYKAIVINKANSLFRKTLMPPHSRPPLSRLTFTSEGYAELMDIFFRPQDGSLRREIRNEVDMTTINDPRYIDFGNHLRGREDKRFQFCLRKTSGAASMGRIRERVTRLFEREGVFNPLYERLDDIGVIVGGTEDQSLHHDVARQYVTWYEHAPESEEAAIETPHMDGWEIDRLKYNAIMASHSAPSSILIGMGPTKECLLGVQKDHVMRSSPTSKRCKILGGCGQEYRIARENKHIVVLVVPTGCLFTGDFPHCGVRNVRIGSEEDMLMDEVNDNILQLIDEHGTRDRIGCNKAVIDMLSTIPGLNRLCRMHCSTKALNSDIVIPFNTIGYSDCWQNEPDDRCYESDT